MNQPISRRSILSALAASSAAAIAAPLLNPETANAAVPAPAVPSTVVPSTVSSAADVSVYLNPGAPLQARIDAIVALMTDEQKLSCLNGLPTMTLADGYVLSGQPNGGVEGLHGSGTGTNATMFPQAIGLGSTWDTELIEQVGHVVGFETRSRSSTSLRAWAPVADVRANPLAGRFEEGYGEDPFHAGTLGTAYAFGIKGRDPFYIMAKPELKHFFAYDHEWNRARSSSSMSIRAFYEFNIVSYRMPIQSGAVLGAMTAYNLVNGVPSIIHPIHQTVREEWAPGNFMFVPDAWDEFNLYNTKGAPYVYPVQRPATPDVSYAAGLSPDPSDDTLNRNTTGALLLLSGMSNFADGNSAGFNGATAARNAVQAGLLGVSMADVERVVRDWLAYKIRTGELDGDANPFNRTVIPLNSSPQNVPSSQELALAAARAQMVLLRNDHGALPLKPDKIGKLAIIGPLGDVNLRDYYSPRPADNARVTPLQGIAARLGTDKVSFDHGMDIVAWQSAAYGTFVTAATGTGAATAAATASTAPIEGGYGLGHGRYVGPQQAFVVYDWGYDQQMFRNVATGGYLNADQTIVNNATVVRSSQATMADGNSQWNTNEGWHYPRNHDGTRSIYGVDYIEDDQFYRRFGTGRYVQVDADDAHTLRPSLDQTTFQGGDASVKATASFTEHVLSAGLQRATASAAAADWAVVVIGNEVLLNARESKDRPGLALAPQQLALVRSVAAARPGRTIVVIESSYPFAVGEIAHNPGVAAILYTSHAGQAAGTALADVLFGDYAPAGRLSASWLADEKSLPKMGPDADGHDAPYTVDMLEYDQIAAGLTYRYSHTAAVYPFGHGLTYTTFAYTGLQVKRQQTANTPFDVTLTVTNTGRSTSDEVVQVYAHSRDSAYGDRVARKQLVAFTRAKAIAPGEHRHISLRVNPADLFVYDVNRQRGVVETGDYDLMVGASSMDIRLTSVIHVAGETIGTLDLSTTRNAWEYYTLSQGVSHWEVSKENTLARKGGYYSVSSRRNGDHIGFTRVRVDGVNGIELTVATTAASWADIHHPSVEVRLDSPSGKNIGVVTFQPTASSQTFVTAKASLTGLHGVKGAHDVYLVFRGAGIHINTVRLLTEHGR